MSTGYNPRHPNASSEGVLGRFWGQNMFSGGVWMSRVTVQYITHISHISLTSTSAMSTPHLGKKLPNLNVTDVLRFTHRVPRGLRHILGSNFEHRHGHSTSQVTWLRQHDDEISLLKRLVVFLGGVTYHAIMSHL